jgi:protein-S-isoprenylcysteine O-methyltransferase Ste14
MGLGPVQRRRRLALLLGGLAAVLVLPFIDTTGRETLVHETVEIFGLVLIVVAILGRSWCTLYIGGRKSREIVATGPYSVSRNPLYYFSLIGIFGIGAQTGSLLLGPLVLGVSLAIFVPTILREEEALSERFGSRYRDYMARVPRFGPRFPAWVDMETVEASPRLLWRTVREGLLFLLALPLCEGIEWLQESGYIVPFIHLP